MSFTPDTTIHFCNVPLDAKNQHVIRFTTKAAQEAYFLGKAVFSETNYTYQRRDNTIRCARMIDELDGVNYVMYRNANYEDRWFYAFITKVDYANENMTVVHIETDVYQTWLFDVTLQKSFVVREHVASDLTRLHLHPENLAYSDPIYEKVADAGLDTLCIIVVMNVQNTSPWAAITGTLQDGIYSAYAYYYYNATTAGASALSSMLNDLGTAGKSSAVIAITMVPRAMVAGAPLSDGTRIPANSALSVNKRVTITKKQSGSFKNVEGTSTYTPKNKKCYAYPYNYLMVTNNMGAEVIYRYEWMTSSTTMDFVIKGDVSPNPSVICAPEYYRGNPAPSPNYAETVTLAGYPYCAWNSDVYKNWLAQNIFGIGVSTIGSAIGLGTGIVTGNPVALIGGALGIANSIGQALEKQVLPPASKGSSSSAITRAVFGIMDFNFLAVHINPEDMERIDNYFEMFGYKVNALKVPALTRPYWNYIQLIDANITGDIPSNDMLKLKKFYEAGITIWHDATKFMDYSQNNH